MATPEEIICSECACHPLDTYGCECACHHPSAIEEIRERHEYGTLCETGDGDCCDVCRPVRVTVDDIAPRQWTAADCLQHLHEHGRPAWMRHMRETQ
ncbi:MAG: hypothetical protein ACODAG_12605 [Myxococcota bacterium]